MKPPGGMNGLSYTAMQACQWTFGSFIQCKGYVEYQLTSMFMEDEETRGGSDNFAA
jgi:hypothetical protein